MTVPPPLPSRAVWIDGRLCRGGEAVLSVHDRGARDGEGLFETLRVYGGRPLGWERHMERLVLSAAVLGFPVPASPAVLRAALDEVLAADGLADAVARITVTRGVPGRRPTRTGAWVEAEPLMARLWRGTRAGAATILVSRRPFTPGPLGTHKTTSRLAYHLAREEARVAEADEALLVSPSGEVLEGAVSNVFFVARGEVITPPLTSGILPGITRALVLELCETAGIRASERVLDLADLDTADEVFVTNSAQEVVPVGTLREAEVAGRPVPGRAIPVGPVAVGLRNSYRERVAAGGGSSARG